MRQSLFRYLYLLIVGIMVGCSTSQEPSGPTATPTVRDAIQHAQVQWNSQKISAYHLRLTVFENFAAAQTTYRDVTVRDGSVVASTCQANRCPSFVLKDVATVEDLFRVAEGTTLPDPRASLDQCIRALQFSATYGFPEHVVIDCPTWFDDDHSVEVVFFEVIP